MECVGGHGPGVWLVVDGRERGVEQFQVFVQRAAQQVIALDTRVARVHVLSQRPAIRTPLIYTIFSCSLLGRKVSLNYNSPECYFSTLFLPFQMRV